MNYLYSRDCDWDVTIKKNKMFFEEHFSED